MSKRLLISVALVAAVTMAISATTRATYVREDGTPSQFHWHAGEAYLFIATNQVGYRPTYLLHGLAQIGLLPFGIKAHDSRPSIVVIKVTPNEVLRHVVEDTQLTSLVAMNGYLTDGTYQWDETGPKALTPDQARRLTARLPSAEYSHVEGWSKRTFVPKWGFAEVSIPFELNGRASRLKVFSTESGFAAIDLQREGLNPERLWSADQRPRTINDAEYNRLFAKGHSSAR
jgi:hypothetical protein